MLEKIVRHVVGKGNDQMIIAGTVWYLFGLLVVATLFESAITYAPSAHSMTKIVLGVTLALAAVFGLGAIWLTIKRKRSPGSPLFHSKPASIVAVCVAGIVTFVVLFGIVG